MNVRVVAAALLAGLVAFTAATVVVAELLASEIAFSLFVGLPVGLSVGVVATILVLRSAGDESMRPLASALASFVLTATIAVTALLFGVGISVGVALVGGVGIGLFSALAVFDRVRRQKT